jgi:DNA-binding beta-propeller fold protein YncE
MRRLVVLGLVGVLAFTFVGSPASRAATVSSTWPVGHNPTGVAVDRTDGRVYVANEGTTMLDGSGRVFVVNPASGAVTQISTSGASDLVALDVAARRLYSSNANRTVDVIDLATQSIVATLPVGGLGVAVDETTHRVYVAGATDIALIDGTTNTVVATQFAPAAQSWFGVALNPARHEVYVTNINQPGQSLVVLDDQTLAVVGEVSLPFPARFALAAAATGSFVYVGSYDGAGAYASSAFYVIDANSRAVVHTTALPGAFPSHLVISPTNNRVYVMDMAGRRVFELNGSSFGVSQVTGLPWQPGWGALHPDGRLYVGAWSADLLAALRVVNSAPYIDSIALSPSMPLTNDVLTATVTAKDDEGDPFTLSYTWARNNVVIAGANSSTLDLSVPGNGDKDDYITVTVTASDGQLSRSDSASVVVGDSPGAVFVDLSNPAPRTDENLGVTARLVDPDNESYSCRLALLVNGVLQFEAGPYCTYTYHLNVHGYGDRGDTIEVRATVLDAYGKWTAVGSATAVIANSAPTAAVSLNTTTPSPKTVLLATAAGYDPDADRLTYVYTWTLNGVVKRTVTTTATTDRYDISVKGNGKKGDVVTVTVTASDGTLTSPPMSVSATIR